MTTDLATLHHDVCFGASGGRIIWQPRIECTRRIIELFAPQLILGISDEIPSTDDIERIRVVGRIVDDHNARQENGKQEQAAD